MLTLFIFNTAFLLIRIARTFLPKQPIAQEVIRGLSAGAFSISEYPQKQEQNPMIGLDQWTDCLSFEVVLVGSSTIMTEALAPRVLIPPTSNERCSAVVGFVSGTFRPSQFYTYTRFWHGYSTVMSAMLQVMPLGGYFYGGVAFAGFYAAMTGRKRFWSYCRCSSWVSLRRKSTSLGPSSATLLLSLACGRWRACFCCYKIGSIFWAFSCSPCRSARLRLSSIR